MAIAYTRVASYPDKYQMITDVTLDTSYSSGGYSLDPKQLGVLAIDAIDTSMVTGEGFQVVYVATGNKLKLYKSAAGATAFTEVVNTDLTASMKVRCTVTGRPIE